MPAKKLSRQQRQRQADPVTHAAMAAAVAEGKARFGTRISAVMGEIRPLLAARRAGPLPPADEVRLMALHAEFNQLAVEEKHFVEAALAERLGP